MSVSRCRCTWICFAAAGGHQRVDGVVDDGIERYEAGIERQLAADDPGDVENVVDELRLRGGVLPNDGGRAQHRVAIVAALAQHVRPAHDGVERRAQFV